MVATLIETTDGLPADQRWDMWRHSALFSGDAATTIERDDFAARRTVVRMPQGTLFDTASSPVAVQRTRRHLQRDGVDHATVFVFLRGRGSLDQGGRMLDAIAPGEVVFQDAGRPFTVAGTENYRELRLFVPRAAFLRVGRIEALAGLRIPADGPLAPLFTRYLADYAAALPTLSADDASVGLDGVLHLLSGLVGRTLSLQGDDGERLAPDSLLGLASPLIAAGIGDPALDAAALARALGVSRTRLYKAFAARGGVAAAIRDARLDRARLQILSPAYRHMKLDAVAFACGFTDYSSFSRAFRARFGESPRALRPS